TRGEYIYRRAAGPGKGGMLRGKSSRRRPAYAANDRVLAVRGQLRAEAGVVRALRARGGAARGVSTLSFRKMSSRCFLTVDSLIPRMEAMSEFVFPWATQRRTSATRGVRPSLSRGSKEVKSGLNSCCAVCSDRSNREEIAFNKSTRATGLVR